jgi:hypothetical protein
LQRDKGRLEATVYEQRLEAMLLDLAATNKTIRDREDGTP